MGFAVFRPVAMVISPYTLACNGDIWYIAHMVINTDTTTRKLVSLPHTMMRAIEDFRFANRIKSESEAFRRLIELGLKAAPDMAGATKPEGERWGTLIGE